MNDRPGFLIQPLSLSNNAATLAGVVMNLDGAARDLKQDMAYNLLGLGNEVPPYGTDDVGREFEYHFSDTVATVWPSVDSYRDQIDRGARYLFGAAQAFQGMDLGGAWNLAELRRQLREGTR